MDSLDDSEQELDHLMMTLAENFNILADQVQLLSDRKTILEHKLHFAHEQYQQLADMYTPSDPAISSTLAKLQLPPELQTPIFDRPSSVPLPSRKAVDTKQLTAEAIRDGRRASQKIAAALKHRMRTSSTSEISETISGTSYSRAKPSQHGTSATTVLEQDFTVPGKRSCLHCPLLPRNPISRHSSLGIPQQKSESENSTSLGYDLDGQKNPPSCLTDPICASMRSEPPSATGSAAKCPIRFLDQRSPEEVARYVEMHKHEIPRSHEICVKRYQRNEEDIRKLDAKYGNLVNMLQALGQKHQPMLGAEKDLRDESSRSSNERVHSWAKAVGVEALAEGDAITVTSEGCRQGRFDRPLKEIRVGESPSRPWGISVPVKDINTPQPDETFDQKAHGAVPTSKSETPVGKCPFGYDRDCEKPDLPDGEVIETFDDEDSRPKGTILQQSDLTKLTTHEGAQVIFNGPVLIGYPVEQATMILQQWQAGTFKT